ncbi:hypothetical protein P170DRAFT_166817 [Aspergillus steynii IBT 23096]|uniref:Uncharacterized protein n=1 Tax=Aspergillus steynii IBT 23096 TaxID=1392250 RepID=A0A2I2G718_9EURO|nr:uncharacterized protein P170DRAFT_166817 [Aspergillus steynii IBT 23096]PLB48676.1 hypothetical protein P170DRAFT_166817 [Aspergillus steynii IBT 23096]
MEICFTVTAWRGLWLFLSLFLFLFLVLRSTCPSLRVKVVMVDREDNHRVSLNKLLSYPAGRNIYRRRRDFSGSEAHIPVFVMRHWQNQWLDLHILGLGLVTGLRSHTDIQILAAEEVQAHRLSRMLTRGCPRSCHLIPLSCSPRNDKAVGILDMHEHHVYRETDNGATAG